MEQVNLRLDMKKWILCIATLDGKMVKEMVII